MRKLIGIELVKMRRCGAAWLVALISVGQSVFYAVMDGRYIQAIARYPRTEYILYIYGTARWFCMASLFMTAYAIAGDFSMRTVLNVLSAGISKRKYYLSRLYAQMLFIFGLYACGFAAFVATRILRTGRISTAFPPLQLLLLFLAMAMQPLAYVAVANMISVCCKRQTLAIVISEAWLFLVLILRMYFKASVLNGKGPMAYEPMWVLESVDQYAGPVFHYGFLKGAVSAAVIIAVSAAAGYLCLTRSDVQ